MCGDRSRSRYGSEMSLGSTTAAARRRNRLISVSLFGTAVAGIIALHLATNGTLGFHTDELYYLDCGRHLAFGYVDFPPIVPVLARLETDLLGVSPWNLRLLPTLLGGFMVALSGLYVRRLGGGLRLQALGLLAALTAPYFLGANWVFQTVTFDELTGMVALYWFLCVVVDRRPRYWIYLGIALGIGLEVKYTIAGLILGITVAVVAVPSLRAELRTVHPWLGALVALLIWAPNLVWQAVEGFPSLQYLTNHGGDIASGGGPAAFLIQLLVYLFFLLPLWLAGLVSLFRSDRLRAIGIACAVPLVLFLFVGKSYYAIATVPIALAQGLIAISRIQRRRLRGGLEIAVVVACILEFVTFVQIVLPITPPERIHAAGLDSKNELFADSVGWSEVADQVTTIYTNLPAEERGDTVIISAYYGVPGAVQAYGKAKLLPAVVSPQLSDYYWLPDHLAASRALMIDYQPADVAWMCTTARLVARLTVPYQVSGLEQGAPVTLCQLRAPLATTWGRLRRFS